MKIRLPFIPRKKILKEINEVIKRRTELQAICGSGFTDDAEVIREMKLLKGKLVGE